jgi:hypothetical protein
MIWTSQVIVITGEEYVAHLFSFLLFKSVVILVNAQEKKLWMWEVKAEELQEVKQPWLVEFWQDISSGESGNLAQAILQHWEVLEKDISQSA